MPARQEKCADAYLQFVGNSSNPGCRLMINREIMSSRFKFGWPFRILLKRVSESCECRPILVQPVMPTSMRVVSLQQFILPFRELRVLRDIFQFRSSSHTNSVTLTQLPCQILERGAIGAKGRQGNYQKMLTRRDSN